MTAKTAAVFFGFVFLALGLLGYISNPIIGGSANAVFYADTINNIIHIASGILFLLFGFGAPQNAPGFLKIFGIFYFVLGIIGLVNIGAADMVELFGFLRLNRAHNYLHIGLGLIVLLAGMFLRKSKANSYS